MPTTAKFINPYSGDAASLALQVLDEGNASKVIHAGRNRLWILPLGGIDVVVKAFRASRMRSWVYAFRPSKARRSFQNAATLLKRGIATPAPIGYVETRDALHRLVACVYVCEFVDSQPLEDYWKSGDKDFIAAFARFVAYLHERGVRHDDLNATNVRVIATPAGYEFSLIDLNRMRIYDEGQPVPIDYCFKNLTRFSCLDDSFRLFVSEYLRVRNLPESMALSAIAAKRSHDRRVDYKKSLKKR